jgi:hypothetical protein
MYLEYKKMGDRLQLMFLAIQFSMFYLMAAGTLFPSILSCCKMLFVRDTGDRAAARSKHMLVTT